MKKINKAALLLMASLVTSNVSYASETHYRYHPNSTFALGRGFEPNTLIEPKLNCLNFTKKMDIDNGAATSTLFTMEIVNSAQDIKKALGVDFSIDARYLQTAASSAFNLNVDSNFNSSSINILISAQSEFGTNSMVDPGLNERAAKLIKNKHFDLFRKECGSHLVTNEILGVKVGVLLTINNLSSKTVNEFKNATDFKTESGAMNLKLKLKLSDEVSRSMNSGSLQIRTYSTGSQGVKDLEGIVTNLTAEKDSLAKIQAELGKYLTHFSANSAVPVAFVAKPFDFGFESKYENLWKSHYETKIQRIAATYRELNYKVSVAKTIYKGDDLRSITLSKQDLKQLYGQAIKIEDYLDALVELHRDCQYKVYDALDENKPNKGNDTSPADYCKFNEETVPEFNLPELPEVPVLIASSDAMNDKNLLLSGLGVREVLLIYANKDGKRIIESFKFQMPKDLSLVTYPVSLDRYWGLRQSHIAGPLRGMIIVKDYFGRTVSYIFHVALYPDQGAANPYFEKFEPTGLEEI